MNTFSTANPVPVYLRHMVEQHRRTERDWVGKKCNQYLGIVWTGLCQYTHCTLDSPLLWDSNITSAVLQAWYNRFLATATVSHNHMRWIRYTLNRLITTNQDATALPLVIQTSRRLGKVLPLRLSQCQEDVVKRVISNHNGGTRTWTTRECYTVRRFVAAFPIWDSNTLHTGVSVAAIDWWLSDRMPLVVPRMHQRWFPDVLRGLLSSITSHHTVHTDGGGCQRTTTDFVPPCSLLYPPSECLCVGTIFPYHCAVFFRHYFANDVRPWVRDMSRVFRSSGCTHIHVRQMWDQCKDFWLAHSPQPRDDFMVDVVPRITPSSVRDWLLCIYRRAGGGGRLTPPCIKALSALRFMLKTSIFCGIGVCVPSRAEYNQWLQTAWVSEESHVTDRPHSFATGEPKQCGVRRTYRDDECHRLLAACRTHRDRLLMLLLQRVALRNTALRMLHVCDVMEGPVKVRAVCEAVEKGGTIRKFCLDAQTVECLRDYLRIEFPTEYCFDTARLFPRSVQQPDEHLSPSQMHWWFQKCCHSAKVSGSHCTLHQFRHYLVTKLMSNTQNRIEDVSQWIGHTNVHTTCAHYWIIDIAELHNRLVFPWGTDKPNNPPLPIAV